MVVIESVHPAESTDALYPAVGGRETTTSEAEG